MREIYFVLLIASSVCCYDIFKFHTNALTPNSFKGSYYQEPTTCHNHEDVTLDYRKAIYQFTTHTFKSAGSRGEYHFIFSPLSIWIILAGIAEGADPVHQKQLFKFLNLPDNICIRQKYYHLATTRIWPGEDVTIANTRVLIVDDGVTVNPSWHNFVKQNFLLDVVSGPLKTKPDEAVHEAKRVIGGYLPSLNLEGNSVILDAFDYNGLWTTSFADAKMKRAPFYDLAGLQIGSVDLMCVKRKVKIAYLPQYNMKALELPIGLNGRYRLLLGIFIDNFGVKPSVDILPQTLVFDFLNHAKESQIPIELEIPRFTITSTISIRTLLEDLGISSIWNDPGASRFITDPPALPSSFIQRATLTIGAGGVSPPPAVQAYQGQLPTGLDHEIGTSFVANKPFAFGLLDAETYSILLASIYTQPTYTN